MSILKGNRVVASPAALRAVGMAALALGIVPTLILLCDVLLILLQNSALAGGTLGSMLRILSLRDIHGDVQQWSDSPIRDAMLAHVPFMLMLFGVACFSRRLAWPRTMAYALLVLIVLVVVAEFNAAPIGAALSLGRYFPSTLMLANWCLTWCIDLLLPVIALAHVISAQKHSIDMSSAEPAADAAPAESIQAALPVLEYSKPVRRWDLPRVVCVVLLVVGVLTCARLLLEMAMMAQTGFDAASQLWPYSLPRALPGDGAMMLLDSWAEYAYRFAWLCITAGAWRALRSESAGIAWLCAASVLLFAWGALESSSMVLSDPPIFTVGGHSIAGVRYCVMIAFAQLATPVLMVPLLRSWRMT